MEKNIGTIDRVLRIGVGLALIAYALGFVAKDTGYNVYGWIGIIPLVTAFVRFCPLYRILGIRTCRTES